MKCERIYIIGSTFIFSTKFNFVFNDSIKNKNTKMLKAVALSFGCTFIEILVSAIVLAGQYTLIFQICVFSLSKSVFDLVNLVVCNVLI